MAAGDEGTDPELWMCKPRQLADLLREAEQDIRRRQARALDIVAAIHRNRVGKALGHDNTMRMLQDNLLLSPTEAGRRLKRALNLCSSQALTGETLAPKLGLVSDAMRRGELADSQIDTILAIVNKLPARVNIEEREGAEASLVEHAKSPPPAASSNLANASTTTSTPTAQHHPNGRTRNRAANRPYTPVVMGD